MRPIRVGLIAALMVAFMAPSAAMAQKAKAAPGEGKADAAGVTEASRKQGMAKGPAAAQAVGVTCQVADARFIGKVPANKAANIPEREFYEIACGDGAGGYIVGANAGGGGGDANNCIETNGGTLSCKLPANLQAAATVGPALAKAGAPCTVTGVRGIGQTASGSFIEVSCDGGVGYIVQGPKPFDVTKPLKPVNCLSYDAQTGGQLKCTLAEPATRLAVVDRYVTTAKVTCAVKDRRYIGTFKDGSEGFEAACNDGKGFVLKVDTKGAVTAQECVKAPGLCELVDAKEAMNEQVALYTKLAKGAGSPCEVTSYAMFPSTPGKEALELTCKNGAYAVGIFPVGGKTDVKAEVLDCGHAMVAGYKCGAGKTKYETLTADLVKLGKTECQVSDVALRAKSDKGQPQIEVACSDGKPGYVVIYTNNSTPADALGCRLTGCTLPTNRPKS